MADKVNNSTAQNKWDSLKGSAGVSLSHIVQGKASSSDFQRVQNILNQAGTFDCREASEKVPGLLCSSPGQRQQAVTIFV
jgi:hypothetical protein